MANSIPPSGVQFYPVLAEINGYNRSYEIQNGMLFVNTLSLPFRAVEKGVIAVCNSSDGAKKVCEVTAESIQALMNVVPESAKEPVRRVTQSAYDELPGHFRQEYGIPEEDTTYFLESVAHIAAGLVSAGVGAAVGKVANGILANIKLPFGKSPVISKQMILETPDKIQGTFSLLYQKQSTNVMNIYVKYLGVNDAASFFGSAQTTGITFQALKSIKQIAKENCVSDIFVQWQPANKQLLDIAHKAKRLEYIR